jgi:hypothetical protein
VYSFFPRLFHPPSSLSGIVNFSEGFFFSLFDRLLSLAGAARGRSELRHRHRQCCDSRPCNEKVLIASPEAAQRPLAPSEERPMATPMMHALHRLRRSQGRVAWLYSSLLEPPSE